jgi:phosphoglycerate dehydrogenase-like enzyme
MPEVLVISQHAQSFADVIEACQLPELNARYCIDSASALEFCDSAEVIFGAPDHIAPLLQQCPQLRWVQSSWAGVKPLIDCQRRDYQLTGVKDLFGPLMGEYVLGWLLALERSILTRSRAASWNDSPESGIGGKTIGIMGTGSIGQHVAGLCRQFGLNTRGLNSNGREQLNFDACFERRQLDSFASDLDYLVTLLPDTADSDDLVDAQLLARLKPGAILINGGRANCIVDNDMVSALANGQLRYAVLDVLREEPLPPEHPFWALENLFITSHTAAPTPSASIVDIFCENYRRYIAGEALHYPIDFQRGY